MVHLLEECYSHAPVCVQNLGISLMGLRSRTERLGGFFESCVDQFAERDRWSADRLNECITGELRWVLCRAFEQVPYYQRVWSEKGIERGDLERITPETICQLPVTPKSALRADPMAFVANDVPRRKLKFEHSSGTTGMPVTAISTADDQRRFTSAREARSFMWAGTSIRESRAIMGGIRVVPRDVSEPPFYRYDWAEKNVHLSAFHLAPAHIGNYVHALNRYQPKLLTGYAHSFYSLARLMLDQNLWLDYEPDAALLGGEKVTPNVRACIGEGMGVRAYEEYRVAENCALATECEYGSLHVSPDFGFLEIVGEDHDPLPPAQSGRVLCTSMLNDTQMLVRYEIGDFAAWSEHRCACGRDQFPVLKEILGRSEDVIVGPTGRETIRVHKIFDGIPNLIEAQIVQESLNHFTIKIVAGPRFSELEQREIRRRFDQHVGLAAVGFEIVTEIPRTDNGRFRAAISKLGPAHQCSSRPEPVL